MTENEMIRNAMPVCLHPLNNKYRAIITKALEEIQQYREIGTPEECKAAVEKMKPKKTNTKVNDRDVVLGRVIFANGTKLHFCPECNRTVTGADIYCRNCGQALIW